MQTSNGKPAQPNGSQQCRVKRAEFVTSLARAEDYIAEELPEIAIVGKSNVGKSSLINALARNNTLARVSGEPGKTRLINIFNITLSDDTRFALVDLPGYGFAKASKQEKERWAGMIEDYLENSPRLKHAFQLVDIRHDPTEGDRAMVDYLRHYAIPFSVIATKSDKLSRAAQGKNLYSICRALQVQPWEVQPASAANREGVDKLITAISELLSHPPEEGNP